MLRAAPACTGLLIAVTATAQGPSAPAREPSALMTIGRLHYDGGGDWYANPSSLPNLLAAVRTRTGLRVAAEERVVTLADDDLWNVPYIYMTGHGNVHFSDADLAVLRRYLEQGGFLHADDNYGMDASLRRELARLWPGRPLVEVPLDHPVYHLIYELPRGTGSSATAAWWSTTRTRATWVTAGRIPRCTTIRPTSARPRCAWASIC